MLLKGRILESLCLNDIIVTPLLIHHRKANLRRVFLEAREQGSVQGLLSRCLVVFFERLFAREAIQ